MQENSMILYEDKDIMVCHKPAGIAVQSARIGQKDLVSILNNHLAEHGSGTVSVVHRLDQPVEGVLVLAKNAKAAAGLTRQITDGSMEKVYRAVCCVTEKAKKWYLNDVQKKKDEVCELTDYLVKDGRTNVSRVAAGNEQGAKEARLSFRILKSILNESIAEERQKKDEKEQYLLVEIHLDTGRHHQIRVQMANAGLPLYGDQKYNPVWAEKGERSELALCSVSLSFRHPVSGKKLKFEIVPRKEIFRKFE